MLEQKNIQNNEIIEAMFKAGAHFGYSKSRRHPSTASYVFGVKNKTEIIDLEKTSELLNKAIEFVTSLAKDNKKILFIGGKSEAKNAIKNGAMIIDMPYVSGRWIGGTLTNAPEIKKRVARFEDLTSQKEKGELSKYTKKERLLIDRLIVNLEEMFGGVIGMKESPKALFVIDPKKEIIAVTEAKKMGIPVIALLNTDCNIKDIDYPIIANDSSVSSISFFVDSIVKAYKAGKTPIK
jgi:small subunit ribosomal protein S2